ncbi:hypothetical protein ACTJJ0_12035 [Chitinophaga sp. 22321]|uniref:Uncharacterized protein n=1 Tax=Chitinophaga hostae TaxID=2831022 RepID=A0ABS5IWJ5_9BACT|nr:hypothetical protein [Chitinophaga hostae]MBS0027337.1 hypothetical protein [Chitinophaga hostae]
MLNIILSFFLAFLCPNHNNNGNHNHNNGQQVTTLDDTDGETGTIPPRKKP